MSISLSLASIEQKLSQHNGQYATARTTRPALAAYATPTALLQALDAKATTTESERYALVAAIVAAHHAKPHAVWTSLLLLGFAPMLHRLRGQFRDADRDQRVLLAFMEAIGSDAVVSAGSFATAAIRRATEKILFAPRALQELEPEGKPFDENKHSVRDPLAPTEAELRTEAALAARRIAQREADHAAARTRVRALPVRRRRAA